MCIYQHAVLLFLSSAYGSVVIPHILYQASNADELMQFISMETGCSVTVLLTSCLSLCMALVLESYAVQHHHSCNAVKDERSVALHNMLINHLSDEVDHNIIIMIQIVAILFQTINSVLVSQFDQLTIHLLSHYWEPHDYYSLASDPNPAPPHFSNDDIIVTLKYISSNWFSSPGVSYIAMLAKTRVCS